MNGFLVKSIEPIEVSLSKRKLVLSPEVWPVCFVSNHEEFTIPSDVTIVMVENPENFIFIEEQKEFFEGMRPLFTTYYPRDTHRSLVNWLETLPNAYIHYGDFDIAGVYIYQDIYKKHIKGFGDAELYDKQLSYRNSIISDEPGIQELMKIIDKEHKGLEQEIFNSKEYKKYTD